MIVLGIESSCDDTGAAVVTDNKEILGEALQSQEEHKQYGGVVPEIAARAHLEHIDEIVALCLQRAHLELKDIDAVAASCGPGLIGGVVVGAMTAKALALALNKPFVAVNHLEGHALCARIANDIEFPYLLLLVSGGHCQILVVKNVGEYERLGTTIDDAAGEAFDKVARAIGLGYPGGPKIDKVSVEGNPEAVDFPRPKVRILTDSFNVSKPTGYPDAKSGSVRARVRDGEYDFSFSGLKSAVLNYLNSERMAGREIAVADVAASFQKAVIDVLVEHSMNAVREYGAKKFAIAGGVASNSSLRAQMKAACEREGIEFYYPSPVFCTDNAAMIGVAGYYEYLKGNFADLSLNAVPNLRLGER